MRFVKLALALLIVLVVGLVGFVYLLPEKAAGIAVDAERQRAGLVRKEIDLPGGLHYVYLEGGQGEPLLLLHGFGANKDNFVRVAKFLTPYFRVIVPDLPGFGESAHLPQADYSPIAQAVRLNGLVQALGFKRVHLGGSSMGGQIALTYAAMDAREVASLWLLDPAGIWSAPPGEVRKIIAETGRNPLMARNEDEFAQILGFAMSDPPFIPRPILDVMAQERIRNFALEERIFKQVAADSVEARVAGLAIPALIVWGNQDRALDVASADILHKLMQRSRVIIMPGVGHLPMIERPQQSAADYLEFRASVPR
jgi:pimeloyl-ACP methyl ester carboxylesterase